MTYAITGYEIRKVCRKCGLEEDAVIDYITDSPMVKSWRTGYRGCSCIDFDVMMFTTERALKFIADYLTDSENPGVTTPDCDAIADTLDGYSVKLFE